MQLGLLCIYYANMRERKREKTMTIHVFIRSKANENGDLKQSLLTDKRLDGKRQKE